MKDDSKSGVNMQEVTDKIKGMFQGKADGARLQQVEVGKANKQDVDHCLKWVDLLYRMVKQISQLFTMGVKSEIELTGHESTTKRQNRKV